MSTAADQCEKARDLFELAKRYEGVLSTMWDMFDARTGPQTDRERAIFDLLHQHCESFVSVDEDGFPIEGASK